MGLKDYYYAIKDMTKQLFWMFYSDEELEEYKSEYINFLSTSVGDPTTVILFSEYISNGKKSNLEKKLKK